MNWIVLQHLRHGKTLAKQSFNGPVGQVDVMVVANGVLLAVIQVNCARRTFIGLEIR